MSAEKIQVDAVEDTSSETRNVNESLSPTFDGLSQEEYIALEKKRKVSIFSQWAHYL
jgi:hypothetical protein